MPPTRLQVLLLTLKTDRDLLFVLQEPSDAALGGLPKAEDATGGSGGVISEDVVHGGQWMHIAATVAALNSTQNMMRVYINGAESHKPTVDGLSFPQVTNRTIQPSGGPLRLGIFRDPPTSTLDYQFTGLMAGVRIYRRALSQEEILTDICFDTSKLLKENIKAEIKEVKEKPEPKELKEVKEKPELKEFKEFKEFKEKELKEKPEPKELKEKEFEPKPLRRSQSRRKSSNCRSQPQIRRSRLCSRTSSVNSATCRTLSPRSCGPKSDVAR